MTKRHVMVMLEQAYRAGWMDAAGRGRPLGGFQDPPPPTYEQLQTQAVERLVDIWAGQVDATERLATENERLATENKRLEGAAVQMSRAARSLEKKIERQVAENDALRREVEGLHEEAAGADL